MRISVSLLCFCGGSGLSDVVGPPSLVEEGLQRSVEADVGKPAFPRHGLDPVFLLADRCGWPEVNVVGAVAIRFWLTEAAQAGLRFVFCSRERPFSNNEYSGLAEATRDGLYEPGDALIQHRCLGNDRDEI